MFMEHSCKFESHPGICLKDHLRLVGETCELKASSITDDKKIIYIAKILGLTHDIGKYTEYFQDHLHNNKKHNKELTSHAPLSSLYTLWLLDKQNVDPFYIAAGMLCVLYHHGSISKRIVDLNEQISEYLNNPNYLKQLESLHNNKVLISEELNSLGLQPIDQFLDDIYKTKLRSIRKKLFEFNYKCDDDIKALEKLYTILLLFSILIDSDKKVTAALDKPQRRDDIDVIYVEEYIKILLGKREDRLKELRTKIRDDILRRFQSIKNDLQQQHIFSINAPTGSGKTLLALTIALLLRKEIYMATGKLYRIIYVLPYINIIEQTYKVFSSILTHNEEDISILLKHHHLYFPESKGESNDDRLMLVESWDSEIIITTFVQFMETLLGTENRMLKKFHKFYNSIIILDEVQTIPVEYWRLLRESLLALSKHSYIIFMTATKPSIFSEGEYIELLDNSRDYFKQLNRVRYVIHRSPMGIDELKEMIINIWNNDASLLVIVNKISTSIEVYNKIKNSLPDLIYVEYVEEDLSFIHACGIGKIHLRDINKPLVIYLSTNIIPRERLNRIRLIDRLIKEKKKVLVISTQLVEAGVDLDFDIVVRDIGPLDSIVQAAGRCNRNWNRDIGTVHVTKLKSILDENRLDAVDIYGALTISITEEVIKDKTEFVESEIYEMIEQYYRLIYRRLNAENSELSVRYLNAIKDLDLETLSSFKVIKNRPTVPVFIEIDEKATTILNNFRDALKRRGERDYTTRAEIRKARTRLEEYIVETYNEDSLPSNTIAAEADYIRYIPRDRISEYYNLETGLRKKRGEDESYIIL